MKQLLLVGLGNPGARFAGTRHNVGIAVLESWVEEICRALAVTATWQIDQARTVRSIQLMVTHLSDQPVKVHGLFPLTFMNNSGLSVAAYLRNHALSPEQMVIIHDDVELPLGQHRLVWQGSAKGHNGVRSIQHALDTQALVRLKLGVGRPPEGAALDEFVLSAFLPEEQAALQTLVNSARAALTHIVAGGLAPKPTS